MSSNKDNFMSWFLLHYNYGEVQTQVLDSFTGWSPTDPDVYYNSKKVIASVELLVVAVEKYCSNNVRFLVSPKLKLALVFDLLSDMSKLNAFADVTSSISLKIMIMTFVEANNRHFTHKWIDGYEE